MKTTAARISSLVLLAITTSASMAQTQLLRKDLLQVLLTQQPLSQIEVKQVTMPVGQTAPKHTHPCPVVGYVASGSVLFQIEGEEKRVIQRGEAFYEPKDKVILHFDNDSAHEPLTFIAVYLKQADEGLIQLVK
ncbi:cupin domain-containing protein [Spirosoma sp. KNUC1025]|uniref:cupin domain-containing protein n=1 Tax=Spirosoma sp. KNUC1025 TaxID=2894082 RepID=UPI001E5B91F4|nr:cupin domain-containing protein [Spirosoma sp. KNUC1025]UFH57851.1 cupin domain-containing protein [Spirosoma sp. KNUC1025]